MNLLKSPLRRTTAAIAGAFIGLVGAVAFAGPASAHTAFIDASTDCAPEGSNGWTVTWKIDTKWTGGKIGNISELNVTGGGSSLAKIANEKTIDPNGSVTETQTFPLSVKTASLSAKIWWQDGKRYESTVAKEVTQKEGCKDEEQPPPAEEPPAEQPPAEQPPAEPTPIVEFNCDTLVIGLDNPKDGVEITLALKTSKGEKRTLTVKPGQKKTEKFSATEGFTVEVGAKEIKETTTVAWEKPADCDATGAGGGGELPVTGANAGTIAGVAGGVLLLGAALFFMARRRKVKFTA